LLNKDRLIKLNIGGKIFKISSACLKAFPESKFSKEFEADQSAKELFYDRTFNNFHFILNFLRERTLNMKKLDKYSKEDLTLELEYYGLSQYLDLTKKKRN